MCIETTNRFIKLKNKLKVNEYSFREIMQISCYQSIISVLMYVNSLIDEMKKIILKVSKLPKINEFNNKKKTLYSKHY